MQGVYCQTLMPAWHYSHNRARCYPQEGDGQFWITWSADSASWQIIFPELFAQTNKFLVYRYPENGSMLGLVSTKIEDNNLLIGAFFISTMVEKTLTEILPSSGQLSIMLVGSDRQVLYRAGDLTDTSAGHPGVIEALNGQSGTVYVNVSKDEHVTAYGPIPAAGWALITEESWESVSTPTLRASQTAPLVLIPAIFIMLLALYFGANQVCSH